MTRTNEINPPHDEKDPDCLSSSEMKYKRFCSNFNEVLAQFSVSISNVDLVFHDSLNFLCYYVFILSLCFNFLFLCLYLRCQNEMQVFFPIHYINHFYVVCFNLKNPAIEILDNNCLGDSITSIYDGYPQNLVWHILDILYLLCNIFCIMYILINSCIRF